MVVFKPGVPICNQVREDDFLLMDEADEIILDYATDSRDLKNKCVVGLTATITTLGQVESNYVLKKRFAILDTKIPGSLVDAKISLTYASIEEFQVKSKGYAKLVYAKEGDVIALEAFRS